jgi:hypothetical protein
VTEYQQFGRAQFQTDLRGVPCVIDASKYQQTGIGDSGSQSIHRFANAELTRNSDQAVAAHGFPPHH